MTSGRRQASRTWIDQAAEKIKSTTEEVEAAKEELGGSRAECASAKASLILAEKKNVEDEGKLKLAETVARESEVLVGRKTEKKHGRVGIVGRE